MGTFLLCFTSLGYFKNILLYMSLFSFSYSLIQSLFFRLDYHTIFTVAACPIGEILFITHCWDHITHSHTDAAPFYVISSERDLPSDLYASYLVTTVCLPCLWTLNPAGTTKWLRQFLLKFSTTSLCDFLHHGLAVWRRFVNDLSMRQCGVFQALDTTCPCKKGPQNPVWTVSCGHGTSPSNVFWKFIFFPCICLFFFQLLQFSE